MSVDEKKNIRLSSLCESLTDVPVCVCVCSHKAEEANVCIAGKKLREGAGQRVCACVRTQRRWLDLVFLWFLEGVGGSSLGHGVGMWSCFHEHQKTLGESSRSCPYSYAVHGKRFIRWSCLQKEVHMVSRFYLHCSISMLLDRFCTRKLAV